MLNFHVHCRHCGNNYDQKAKTAPGKCGACGERLWRPRLGERVKFRLGGEWCTGTVATYEGSTVVAVDLDRNTSRARFDAVDLDRNTSRARFEVRELHPTISR